jgi:hypothetical protein
MGKRISKKWRSRARDIYIECDGDVEKCKEKFKQQYGSIMTILAILQILITLWELWSRKGIKTPTYTPSGDEPNWVDEDDDLG